jgi:hypothetical protein
MEAVKPLSEYTTPPPLFVKVDRFPAVPRIRRVAFACEDASEIIHDKLVLA